MSIGESAPVFTMHSMGQNAIATNFTFLSRESLLPCLGLMDVRTVINNFTVADCLQTHISENHCLHQNCKKNFTGLT